MLELDFPHKYPENLTYVGPMVFENRIDLFDDAFTARRLEQIYSDRRADGKKLIYCSVGSLAKGDVSFLTRVIDIVGQEEQWSLILSLGRNLSKEVFSRIPKNVHLFDWVPQLNVLAHADCCINHAGINSINECLHHAVPMLIYSLKYTDENGNAARMAYHGLAVIGDKDEDDVPTIRKKLTTVLNDSRYRDTLSEYNTLYRNYCQRKLTPLLFHGTLYCQRTPMTESAKQLFELSKANEVHLWHCGFDADG